MQQLAALLHIGNNKTNRILHLLGTRVDPLRAVVVNRNEKFTSQELIYRRCSIFFISFLPACDPSKLLYEICRFRDLLLISLWFDIGVASVRQSICAQRGEFMWRGEVVVLHKWGGGTSSKRTEYPSKWTCMVVLVPYLLMALILPSFHLCSS